MPNGPHLNPPSSTETYLTNNLINPALFPKWPLVPKRKKSLPQTVPYRYAVIFCVLRWSSQRKSFIFICLTPNNGFFRRGKDIVLGFGVLYMLFPYSTLFTFARTRFPSAWLRGEFYCFLYPFIYRCPLFISVLFSFSGEEREPRLLKFLLGGCFCENFILDRSRNESRNRRREV